MKLKIQLKDPDGVYNSIQRAAEHSTENTTGLHEDEVENLIESRRVGIEDYCSRWIKYSECVTIEIDTEAGTAVVCPV